MAARCSKVAPWIESLECKAMPVSVDLDRSDGRTLSGAATPGYYLGGNKCYAPSEPQERAPRLNPAANLDRLKAHQELDLLSNANLRPAQGGGLSRGDVADSRQRNGMSKRPFVHCSNGAHACVDAPLARRQ